MCMCVCVYVCVYVCVCSLASARSVMYPNHVNETLNPLCCFFFFLFFFFLKHICGVRQCWFHVLIQPRWRVKKEGVQQAKRLRTVRDRPVTP